MNLSTFAFKRIISVPIVLLVASSLQGEEWPQFLGPNRDGHYHASDVSDTWPKTGPHILWRKEIGQGFSSPVVSQGRLILFHRIGNQEKVDCLDAKTGSTLWSYGYPTGYRDDFGFDEGPRATPTIDGSEVYTLGAEGMLHCLDFATGKKKWSVDTRQRFSVQKGFFGVAGSPLIEGKAVLLNVGGAGNAGLAAFDKDTGNVIWTATNDEASYSSPVAATMDGMRHVFFFTRSGLTDVDPLTGQVRFQFPWRARIQASVNAAVPLIIENHVFLSASYQTGAVLLEVNGSRVKKLWSSDEILSNHYATSTYLEGYLYGFHGRQEYGPSLRCVELKTGKVQWSEEAFKAGTITLADKTLLILRENGELIFAQASPKEFHPTARIALLTGTVRSYPALANGFLYARNEKTLICVDLKKPN
jgi:outer membrane protein assembly factor BamB